MSGVPVVLDRNDRKDPGCRQLLAVRELRRSLERVAFADGLVSWATMAVMRTRVVRELLELIAALDRRVPQVHRASEASIARDAALKARALKRIEELEQEPSSVEPG